MKRKRGYVFHWWGSPVGKFSNCGQCAETLRAAQRMHMGPGGLGTPNGGNDIAYNYVICQHGTGYECRGDNVVSGANGGQPQNSEWVAVCFMFGPGDEFTLAMRQTGEILAMQIGGQRRNHNDFIKTECPGTSVVNWKLGSSEPPPPVVHKPPYLGPTIKLGADKLRKEIVLPKGDTKGYVDTDVPFDRLISWFISGPSPDRDGWDSWSEPITYVNNTNGQARIVVEKNDPPRELHMVVIWEA